MATIPTIDLGPYLKDEGVCIGEGATDGQQKTAAALHECCSAHGFAHITNFGLTRELEEKVFAASTQLFDLPEEAKNDKLTRITPKTNTGYSPFAFEMLNRNRPPDLKEAFNVRSPEVHPPDGYFSSCPDAFRGAALELWEVLQKAARAYALACAVALDLETDFFSKTLKRMDLCTLRFLQCVRDSRTPHFMQPPFPSLTRLYPRTLVFDLRLLAAIRLARDPPGTRPTCRCRSELESIRTLVHSHSCCLGKGPRGCRSSQ